MAYSTFQPVTGPTGPEGVKAPGVIGVTGNTGPTGATGANSPHLIEYEYPHDNNSGKVKFQSICPAQVSGITMRSIPEWMLGKEESVWLWLSYHCSGNILVMAEL